MKKYLVLMIVVMFATTVGQVYGVENRVLSPRARRDTSKVRIRVEPFKSLLDWTKTEDRLNAYNIAFTAVSMDRYGKATYIKGVLAPTQTSMLRTMGITKQLFSHKTLNSPFATNHSRRVTVQLDCINKRARISYGSRIIYIPLKAEKGIYHGFSGSKHDQRAKYTFSFKKIKTAIVQ